MSIVKAVIGTMITTTIDDEIDFLNSNAAKSASHTVNSAEERIKCLENIKEISDLANLKNL